MGEPTTQPVRRAKHLIDPNAPRPRQRTEDRVRDEARLAHVKQWVMSVLVVTTMFHLAVGLSLAAIFTVDDRVDGRIGLNAIAAVLLIAGIAAARVIHKKNPVSVWLALGVVPPLVGLWLSFR